MIRPTPLLIVTILLFLCSCITTPEDPREPAAPPRPPSSRPDRLHYARATPPLPCRVLALAGGEIRFRVERKQLSLIEPGAGEGKKHPDLVLPRDSRTVLACRILAENGEDLDLEMAWTDVLRLDRADGIRSGSGEKNDLPGSLSGRVFWRNRPLGNALIRLVRLTEKSLVPGILEAPPRKETSVETEADGEGRFHLERLPPGGYKLWVRPRGETEWIRRIRMIPDVLVLPGRHREMEPFRIKRVIG